MTFKKPFSDKNRKINNNNNNNNNNDNDNLAQLEEPD